MPNFGHICNIYPFWKLWRVWLKTRFHCAAGHILELNTFWFFPASADLALLCRSSAAIFRASDFTFCLRVLCFLIDIDLVEDPLRLKPPYSDPCCHHLQILHFALKIYNCYQLRSQITIGKGRNGRRCNCRVQHRGWDNVPYLHLSIHIIHSWKRFEAHRGSLQQCHCISILNKLPQIGRVPSNLIKTEIDEIFGFRIFFLRKFRDFFQQSYEGSSWRLAQAYEYIITKDSFSYASRPWD